MTICKRNYTACVCNFAPRFWIANCARRMVRRFSSSLSSTWQTNSHANPAKRRQIVTPDAVEVCCDTVLFRAAPGETLFVSRKGGNSDHREAVRGQASPVVLAGGKRTIGHDGGERSFSISSTGQSLPNWHSQLAAPQLELVWYMIGSCSPWPI
jgi:hypothetical protein